MIALVIALATALLLTARWALNRHQASHGISPPRDPDEEGLWAEAHREQERAKDLGTAAGNLWAWRDLLSDTAVAARTESGEDGAAARLDTRRRGFDEAEGRIRDALADLGPRHVDGPARSGARPGGSAPWSG
ncbi:hypothetical protein PWG71_17380 [Nocardiopsis sp. N85]|uniref:hypothetical protein n=1 Tax=Nocardiopsis sp. N85 TaxID=3029400 RepID=UPI00237EF86A|nr:hypothetical protein [Nocardiopsis sp. N85]MDE3723167.1 hypothetical protein [Nocardiopsis sp. N85]